MKFSVWLGIVEEIEDLRQDNDGNLLVVVDESEPARGSKDLWTWVKGEANGMAGGMRAREQWMAIGASEVRELRICGGETAVSTILQHVENEIDVRAVAVGRAAVVALMEVGCKVQADEPIRSGLKKAECPVAREELQAIAGVGTCRRGEAQEREENQHSGDQQIGSQDRSPETPNAVAAQRAAPAVC